MVKSVEASSRRIACIASRRRITKSSIERALPWQRDNSLYSLDRQQSWSSDQRFDCRVTMGACPNPPTTCVDASRKLISLFKIPKSRGNQGIGHTKRPARNSPVQLLFLAEVKSTSGIVDCAKTTSAPRTRHHLIRVVHRIPSQRRSQRDTTAIRFVHAVIATDASNRNR